jgi:hypothetical protein
VAEEQTQTPESQQAAPQFTPEQVSAMAEELERLKKHHGTLLDETKTAKQRAKELEDAKAKAEQESLKKSGEFQKLWETEAEKAARIQNELDAERDNWRKERQAVQQKEIGAESVKIASSIAVDDSSLELLTEQVQKFAVYTENGIEYQVGGVSVPKEKVIEMLTEKYPRLVKGSGATGGGATGGNRGGGASEKTNAAAEDAKKRGDLAGYVTAMLNQQS